MIYSFSDHGFPICQVAASCLQEALETAQPELEFLKIQDHEWEDYPNLDELTEINGSYYDLSPIDIFPHENN